MEERQKNGLEEALETGASAAHLARGAVKAGKAVSGAAMGAAVGGPYGAAAGALWEGRKFAGKFLAAAAVLLLLPVLFVLMLPGLIFDGFSSAFSPADTENPILNSETAIVENANTITFTISSILGKAWKMSWNGSSGILPPRTGMKWRSSTPTKQAPYTMPTFSSPSTARQRIRNLRISPFRTWRLSCAGGNPTFTLISGPRRSVKRRWRTRKPGKRPPYPKNG